MKRQISAELSSISLRAVGQIESGCPIDLDELSTIANYFIVIPRITLGSKHDYKKRLIVIERVADIGRWVNLVRRNIFKAKPPTSEIGGFL